MSRSCVYEGSRKVFVIIFLPLDFFRFCVSLCFHRCLVYRRIGYTILLCSPGSRWQLLPRAGGTASLRGGVASGVGGTPRCGAGLSLGYGAGLPGGLHVGARRRRDVGVADLRHGRLQVLPRLQIHPRQGRITDAVRRNTPPCRSRTEPRVLGDRRAVGHKGRELHREEGEPLHHEAHHARVDSARPAGRRRDRLLERRELDVRRALVARRDECGLRCLALLAARRAVEPRGAEAEVDDALQAAQARRVMLHVAAALRAAAGLPFLHRRLELSASLETQNQVGGGRKAD